MSQVKKGNAVYVRYVVGRTYHPEKKYNIPDQRIIGKRSENDPEKMIPNENYMKYFGDLEQPEERESTRRSSCIRTGAFPVIQKILESYGLSTMTRKYFGERESGLVEDLAAYSIISENNAAQYYPTYACNHPLFTEKMHMYSDTKVSGFLVSVTDDQRIGLVNDWNEKRDHREKIYISYDSTNRNCQAGDIEFVEYGHSKDGKGIPVFNYSIAYDTVNKEPLFYEQYPGSVVDISQLQFMLEKARGYGYRKVGFILDRGYFGKENIEYMDQCGYDFVIMMKGMKALVRKLLHENKQGQFREHKGAQYQEIQGFRDHSERKAL